MDKKIKGKVRQIKNEDDEDEWELDGYIEDIVPAPNYDNYEYDVNDGMY